MLKYFCKQYSNICLPLSVEKFHSCQYSILLQLQVQKAAFKKCGKVPIVQII